MTAPLELKLNVLEKRNLRRMLLNKSMKKHPTKKNPTVLLLTIHHTNYSKKMKKSYRGGGTRHGVVANMQDCKVCSKSSKSITFISLIIICGITILKTIILIFIYVCTTFRPMCPSAFYRNLFSNSGAFFS